MDEPIYLRLADEALKIMRQHTAEAQRDKIYWGVVQKEMAAAFQKVLRDEDVLGW